MALRKICLCYAVAKALYALYFIRMTSVTVLSTNNTASAPVLCFYFSSDDSMATLRVNFVGLCFVLISCLVVVAAAAAAVVLQENSGFRYHGSLCDGLRVQGKHGMLSL